jgi:hypothetical protein
MTEGEVERLKIGDRLRLEDRTGTILAFYDSVDGPRLVAIKWDEEAKPEAYTLARIEHDLTCAADLSSPRPQFSRYDGRGQQ